MRYEIRLRFRYDFGAPAGGGRHLLRMLPPSLPGAQEVEAATLSILPEPAERRRFTDFFGNPVEEAVLTPGATAVVFEARARVRRHPPEAEADLSVAPKAIRGEVAAVRDLGPDSPHHFLAPSPRIPADAAIAAFAAEAAAGAASVAAAALAVAGALRARMRFVPAATAVDTLPGEAFAAGAGVCQDYAQILIAALRALGIPAGYVSGFLRTRPPPGQPRREGADAMHAWVRFWGGRAPGWADYDPTNACAAGEDHIVVARGRDYGDVAPVMGVLRLAGAQQARQMVDVLPLGGG